LATSSLQTNKKDKVYAKKEQGWRERKTTSHWPNLETWFRERPKERERVRAFTQAACSDDDDDDANSDPPGERPPSSSTQLPVLATERQRLLHGLQHYEND
jgi:hypothetical protein